MSDAAVTQEEFDRLLAPLAWRGDHAAVAVSGGADSMALAWCLGRCLSFRGNFLFVRSGSEAEARTKESLTRNPICSAVKNKWDSGFAASAAPRPALPKPLGVGRNDKEERQETLLALIVDHRLRPESTAEAQEVAARLAALGIESEILTWAHEEDIDSRIHVRARAARYALLIEACKKHNIDTLFLAHHADDQAETVLMRLAKGSGIDGLSGIAPASMLEGVRLLRPFLPLAKARLIATCAAAGIEAVRDPSNEKEKYARGRLRRVMPLLESEGLSAARLCDLATRAREAKDALDHYAQSYLREHAALDTSGAVTLDLKALAALPSAVAQRAVAAALSFLHDTGYAPPRAALLPFLDWLLQDKADAACARTLHGCLAHKNAAKKTAVVLREASAIPPAPIPIAPAQSLVWDGRWRVRLHTNEQGLCVRPLGAQPHAALDALAPTLRRQIPRARARESLPALWRGAELVAIPALGQENHAVASAFLLPPFWAKEES